MVTVKSTEKENVSFLIGKLIKECATSKGYIGVEYDNLTNGIESLFNCIMNEMNVLNGNPDEYVEEEDSPFRTYKNVTQHIKRLCKFVEKYAPLYLDEENATRFIKEAKGY